MSMTHITGARAIIECLLEQGVDMVFGYPGGTILNVYDELYKLNENAESSGAPHITHILTAHEQGAAHAADGYARASGKVGVVLATSGPGAANLVTGIATAYMDSVPLVAITCNVALALLGKDSFQEIDIAGITSPITKHNYIVKDVNELVPTIREAFAIAKSGRQGPVLIDVPKNVTAEMVDYDAQRDASAYSKKILPSSAGSSERLQRITFCEAPLDDEIKNAARAINDSERPLIFAGGGVVASGACNELKTLAEKCNIPVAVSLMGKTAFPQTHKLATGLIGMHGTKASNTAINTADLVIALGVRFSDRVISDSNFFAKNARILHIDIDKAEVNKNIDTWVSLSGNVKEVLQRIIPHISPIAHNAMREDWLKKIDELKKTVPAMYSKKSALHPKRICEIIREKAGSDALICTEVGQHQIWAAQFYEFVTPRTFLTSGGLGTMGFGLGAAIGAQLAFPERYVINIAGDGCVRMNSIEFATIAHYKLPVIEVIFNNGTLGMVRQWQNLFYAKRFSETTLDFAPDFVKLADAYGIAGFSATTEADFEKAFTASLSSRAPAIIDCKIEIDELVLPMVPTGKPVDAQLFEI
ncbi:MAG: biosynthetic-type acetolactate synthase large subunit [Treponemataceae bacterium]|nr:MAG: biosynthetic-type acetolactate synthase large subunit [Treponemataceae bacterium]